MLVGMLPMHAQAAESVVINETTFPDDNFRAYILSQDYGADGVLTSAELSNVTSIDVWRMDIADITGIEYFTALTYLNCCANRLTELDVSKNTSLIELQCAYNQLTALNVSENAALMYLRCEDNRLTVLDVSKNWALESLQCANNCLSELDVSKNQNLGSLHCLENKLTKLDVSKNPILEYLSCESNQLAALDVSKNTSLRGLSCESNQLTTLDIGQKPVLSYLSCFDNELTVLDLSESAALTTLDCSSNKLIGLNLNLTALTELDCGWNQLTKLDVSKNAALEKLECGYNQLKDLDLGKNTKLSYLVCAGNQLTALDVSKNTELTSLACHQNQLTEMDVSKNMALTTLSCDQNQLTALDVSKNPVLERLDCYNNRLTELDVSKNPMLKRLDCGYNQLIKLDVSKNLALEQLDCSRNQLTALDVSKNPALTSLLSYQNLRIVSSTQKQFDLSNLAEDGFDISKVSNWQGGWVSGNLLTATSETVTYTYNMGNGYTGTFVLSMKEGPVILRQPVNATELVGDEAVFYVEAIGTGLTYQWQYMDPAVGKWYNSGLTGSKTANLTVDATIGRNGYLYRCKISDISGNVTYSDAAKLTVRASLEIITQPADVTATVGSEATFQVVASGRALTYQWQWRKDEYSQWAATTVAGAKTNTISVPATAGRSGYQYRCKITNAYGDSVYTNAVTLTVKAALAVTTQPKSITATVGDTVTFKVVATGTGLTYQWQWRANSSSAWAATTVSGNKTATITVPATTARNGYQYRCKITDSKGNVLYSNAATLTVKSGPVINTQPASVTANVGATATFKVVATGTGLTYQWQWRANSSSTWASTTVSGNRTAAISVPATAARNGYQYRCVVTDGNGNKVYSNAVTLTVKAALAITTQPKSTSAAVGGKATFTIKATGDGLTYQWYYKKPGSDTWTTSSQTSTTYSFTMKESYDGRSIRCLVKDAYGNEVTSDTVSLKLPVVKITSQRMLRPS